MARVDSTKVRLHVQQLVGQGMPGLAIARRARTSKCTVQDLLSERRTSIDSDLEQRLLNVRFDPAFGPKGRYAAEDRLMLMCLNRMGWDNITIATGVGMNENTVRRIIAGQASITHEMHRLIKRFYASHWAFDGGNDRARWRAERRGYPFPKEWDGTPVPHGTMTAYTRGCHCEECRAANAEYKAAHEKRKLLGIVPDTTDAEPARLHVLGLTGQDMPLGAIAAKAGVSRQYLQRLVHGVDGNVTQTIPTGVDKRIRSVGYDPSYLKTGLRHPAGTERRLRGLVWMRWDVADISNGTGLKAAVLNRIIAGKAGHITRRVYELVKRFYDANWLSDGGSAAARNRAIRERFAPPSAWSEFTIDNPQTKPLGVDPAIYEGAAS